MKEKLVIKSVKLTEAHWARARELGAGNMTAGIRHALNVAAAFSEQDLIKLRQAIRAELIQRLMEKD